MTTTAAKKKPKASGGANPVIDGISLAAFLAAIAGKESGNYTAVNPDSGALGKYQVLPSNVPTWSKEALGYSLTPQQFLSSPAAQEKIVRFKLGGYFRSYGPAGAASAWYSGSPSNVNNTAPQGAYPSVASYVQDVYNAARANMHLKPKQLQLGSTAAGSVSGGTVQNVVDLGGVAKAVTSPLRDAFGWLGSKTVSPLIVDMEKLATQSLIVLAGVGIIVVGAYEAFKRDDGGNSGGGGMLMPAPGGGAKGAGAAGGAGEAAELAPLALA